jgi:hypothetical protein
MKKRSYLNIIYNLLYQIKKTIKIKKSLLPIFPYLLQYIIENRKISTTLDTELPWINIGAFKFLKKRLRSDMKVFEYGSGGSTLFFSKYVAEVISVEHDESWYKFILEKISKISNIKLYLKKPQLKETNKYGSYYGKGRENYSFEEYVKTIEDYPDSYFDLIVIDGRARPACLEHALPKLKPSGYILFDNSERDRYLDSLSPLKQNLVYRMYGPTFHDISFNETSIYQL